MPGAKYRLTYFPVKGRGELIRLIFHAARVPFVDRRVTLEEWKEIKPTTPTGKLPMLELEDGQMFPESAAIANWAARKFGLMGKTDAEELRVEGIMYQATDLREKFIIPYFFEKDAQKRESLKKALEDEVKETFTIWEKLVVQTESKFNKTYSYMINQSLTAADLALLYISDLVESGMAKSSVDWTAYPRLKAVIETTSNIQPVKAYLSVRDKITVEMPAPQITKPASAAANSKPGSAVAATSKPGSAASQKAGGENAVQWPMAKVGEVPNGNGVTSTSAKSATRGSAKAK